MATKLLYEEQDIQQIIAAGRLVRLFSRLFMNKRQRKTVNFFKRYVIDDEAVRKSNAANTLIT